ncbi:glycosyltransferase family 2 protein [Patescibacteria group bacterium]|nr:glycosyltransferase family 2 protein [Patescibacteria group bacterium]
MLKTVKSQTSPFFSIVIPTLNEEKFLPKLLADLEKQTFKNFEVIHVDGKSDDSTCVKAADFSQKITLQTVISLKRNVSHQRNTGGKFARGQWVVFMDADNRLKRSFLSQLAIKLETNSDTEIFTCLIDNKHTSVVMKNLLDLSNLIMVATAKVRPFAAGALIGIKREKLKHIQFDCDAKMSEDHLFVEEAVKNGCKYRVFTQPRYSFSMRRFEKEGSVKVIVAYVRSGAILLAGPRFERFLPEYPMMGGSDYNEDKALRGFLPSMRDIISSTTKRQQKQMRVIISRLQQLINDI